MKIVVIGGSGLIGSRLVDLLRQSCMDVVSTSRAEGVNTVSGEGLDDVLEDAEVVIDMTKPPSLDGKAALEFFEASGRNIIVAETKAGVAHHIALSVVGTDSLQDSAYFRAKLAQENLVRESAIPHTIVRSTQFFEFLRGIADANTDEGTVYLPPVLAQPIAADDVAAILADIPFSAPVNAIVEVAGPEPADLVDLMRRFLVAMGDPRPVIADDNARYFGAVLNHGSLTPSVNPRLGSQSFDAWLSEAQLKAATVKAGHITRPLFEA